MRKYFASLFLTMALLAAALTALAGAPTVKTYAQDNWSFQANSNWVTEPDSRKGGLALINNPTQQARILFFHIPFEGSTEDFAEAMLAPVSRDKNAKVLSVQNDIIVNNNAYSLSTVIDNGAGVYIYSWLMVKHNWGWAFVCAGAPAANLTETCLSVANTLEIK